MCVLMTVPFFSHLQPRPNSIRFYSYLQVTQVPVLISTNKTTSLTKTSSAPVSKQLWYRTRSNQKQGQQSVH